VARRPRSVVVAEFHEMLEESSVNGHWTVKCKDKPDLYVDYKTSPNVDKAEALCEGCPFKQLCNEYADAVKPAWGVWAGRTWVGGKLHFGEVRTAAKKVA
jgi:hypothetical protein